MRNKTIFVVALCLLLSGCTKRQREGWEKRIEKVANKEEQTANLDTLDPNHFTLSDEKQELIGLETTLVQMRQIADVLDLPAELRPNPNRVVAINAPMRGRLSSLRVNLGSKVKRNEVVAVIENPENLGQKFEVRSPISGIISRRPVNAGEWVENGAGLMQVTDFTSLVGVIRVYEQELPRIKEGEKVDFTCEGQSVSSTISFISPEIDPKTRTVEVWAVIANPQGEMEANSYASARVVVDQKTALVVPRSALLREEAHFIVFVQNPRGFEKRIVQVGSQQNGWVEIVSGLHEGESVVSKGAYQLKNINFSSFIGEEEEE